MTRSTLAVTRARVVRLGACMHASLHLPKHARTHSRMWVLTHSRPLAAAAATLAIIGAAPVAAAQTTMTGDLPSQSAARTTAQVASGIALAPIGYVGGGLATRAVARAFGASDDAASRLANKGAYVGIALASASGPALVGARGPGSGRYPAALGGAVAGGLASALVVRLNRPHGDRPCRLVCSLSAVAVVALPSVGATLAYNASRRR